MARKGKRRKDNDKAPKEGNGDEEPKASLPEKKRKVAAIAIVSILILGSLFVYEYAIKDAGDNASNNIDRSISFPRDGGSHEGELMEFWTFSATFRNGQGDRFGYQVSYISSGRREATFTDEQNVTGRPYYFTRDDPANPENPGLHITASSACHNITYTNTGVHDRWAESETEMFKYSLDSVMNFQPSGPMVLNLTLASNKKPLLVGDKGKVTLMQYGDIYLYQITNLSVSGTMRLGGQTYSVAGFGRMEHLWGSNTIGSYETWGLMLSNGKELSVTRLYDPPTNSIFLQYSYLIENDGSYDVTMYSDIFPLASDFSYDDYQAQNLSIQTKRYLVDPVDTNKIRCYGHGWRFTSERNHFDLHVDPTVTYQRNYMGYVGTVAVSGNFKGLAISGTGHVNLMATYDSTLRLIELSDTATFNMETEIPNDPVKVTVILETGMPPDNALLHYRINDGDNQTLPLTIENETAGIWAATIPGQVLGTRVEYWIYIDNLAGKSIMTETVSYLVKVGS